MDQKANIIAYRSMLLISIMLPRTFGSAHKICIRTNKNIELVALYCLEHKCFFQKMKHTCLKIMSIHCWFHIFCPSPGSARVKQESTLSELYWQQCSNTHVWKNLVDQCGLNCTSVNQLGILACGPQCISTITVMPDEAVQAYK